MVADQFFEIGAQRLLARIDNRKRKWSASPACSRRRRHLAKRPAEDYGVMAWSRPSIGPRPSGGKQTSIRSDLPLQIEDYALIGDCITAALVRVTPSTFRITRARPLFERLET
jgi:hypothetical protein